MLYGTADIWIQIGGPALAAAIIAVAGAAVRLAGNKHTAKEKSSLTIENDVKEVKVAVQSLVRSIAGDDGDGLNEPAAGLNKRVASLELRMQDVATKRDVADVKKLIVQNGNGHS